MRQPLSLSKIKPADAERFHRSYERDASGCWNWVKALSTYGYGHLSFNSRPVRAHRFSFALHNGVDPKNMLVCHSCDNKRCVNPDHLWLGTNLQNMRDMVSKRRSRNGQPVAAVQSCT